MKNTFFSLMTLFFLVITFLSASSILGQGAENLMPKSINTTATSSNQAHTVYGIPSGTKSLPEALGGGEVESQSLMITSSTFRGGTELSPSQFDAVSLHPGKWLDDSHFLFIASDEIDIQDYYLYVVAEDKVYVVDFEVAEEVGYMEIEAGTTVHFKIENEIVTNISFL